MKRSQVIQQFWNTYQRDLSEDHEHKLLSCPEAWSFGFEKTLADELAQLVLNGSKTATCSRYLGENLLDDAGLSIITNGDGFPLCLIETYEITIKQFKEVDAQFAADEGEGDLSLECWRKGHWEYFTNENKIEGYDVNEDMLLACKRFRVISMR